MLPLASGMLGSSGEKRHSPSTMNLYLDRLRGTGGGLAEVAVLGQRYYGDWKLIPLLLQWDGLLPFVEGACEEDLVAAVIPSEFCEDVGVFDSGLIVGTSVDFAEWGWEYPELLTKLIVLFKLLGFWMELLEAGFPIVLFRILYDFCDNCLAMTWVSRALTRRSLNLNNKNSSKGRQTIEIIWLPHILYLL